MNSSEQQPGRSKSENLQELFNNLPFGKRVDCYVEQELPGTVTEAGQPVRYDCELSARNKFQVSDYADGSVIIEWDGGSKRFDGARVQSDRDGIIIMPIQ
jgi:hypothetical protein